MRYPSLLVGIPLLAGSVTSATAHELFREPDCVRAAEWVEVNRNDLPTTLDGYAALDPEVRRTAYLSSPRVVKIGLWEEQLGSYINSGGLTEDQVEFVRWAAELVPMIIPKDGAKITSSATDSLIAEVIRGASTTLSPELTTQLFFVLGSITSNGALVIQEEQARRCNCHIGSQFSNCGVGHVPTECLETYNHEGLQFYCAPVSFGCGAFFTESCDGWCKQAL